MFGEGVKSSCQGGDYFQSSGSVKDKLKWQFMLYDRDGSGEISKEEMLSMFLTMCQHPHSEESVERKMEANEIERKAEEMFTNLDEDGDEKVTLDEFIKGCMSDEELLKQLSTS